MSLRCCPSTTTDIGFDAAFTLAMSGQKAVCCCQITASVPLLALTAQLILCNGRAEEQHRVVPWPSGWHLTGLSSVCLLTSCFTCALSGPSSSWHLLVRKWPLSLSPWQLPNSDCAMSATLTEMDDVPSKLNRLITRSQRLDAALMQLPSPSPGPQTQCTSFFANWSAIVALVLYKQISLTSALSFSFLPSCITCTSSLTLDPRRPLPFPFACKCAQLPNRYHFYQFFHNSYSTPLVIWQRHWEELLVNNNSDYRSVTFERIESIHWHSHQCDRRWIDRWARHWHSLN